MLAATVIKNTVTKRLWNFQIRFLPYSNAFEKKFFFQTCSFIIFFNFVPEVISRKCLLQLLLKTRILSAFGIFKSVSCLIRMRLRKNFFQTCSFIIFFNFVPEVISRKCLLQPLLKTRLLSAFGIFKSVSCLIRMRLRKNFFPNMLFYHFLQLCPRGHIAKMLAATVIKNTVTKRLWNFQIRFLPYSNAFEKKFFSKHVLLSFSSTLSPKSYRENACCNRY